MTPLTKETLVAGLHIIPCNSSKDTLPKHGRCDMWTDAYNTPTHNGNPIGSPFYPATLCFRHSGTPLLSSAARRDEGHAMPRLAPHLGVQLLPPQHAEVPHNVPPLGAQPYATWPLMVPFRHICIFMDLLCHVCFLKEIDGSLVTYWFPHTYCWFLCVVFVSS